MGIHLNQADVFPVPGNTANSVYGCVVVSNVKVLDIGRNQYLQSVNGLVYIPERSCLFPSVTEAELRKLTSDKKLVFHPDFGLVELGQKILWEVYIEAPLLIPHRVDSPVPGIRIPGSIKSFQVSCPPPEEVIKSLENESFPQKENEEIKPLNLFEKAKLEAYKLLFSKEKPEGKGGAVQKPILSGLAAFSKSIFGKDESWTENLKEDFEELEFRNQNQVDRLLDFLKNNPEEALKYAIPLDERGVTRGESTPAGMGWAKRWLDFSLTAGSSVSGGSGNVYIGDKFYQLQAQYQQTALDLIKKKEYEKAAFIYLKLLKNYLKAAETLEEGNLYAEAAAIYIKHCLNKGKAAACYEKGRMYAEAIEIYKELNENEKVGDLYLELQNRVEAMHYFEKVVDAYSQKHQYVKAALLSKNKMQNIEAAQTLLLQGWRSDRDSFNCLNNYFNNIKDIKTLKTEISNIYSTEVQVKDQELFLQVIKHEYNKQNELTNFILDIAYKIISERLSVNPQIVSELPSFNKKDRELVRDTIRFSAGS